MAEIGLLLVTDSSGTVLLAEGAALARFDLPGEPIGRPVAEVCQRWPLMAKAMVRAQAGEPAELTVEAGGGAFKVRFEPRQGGAGAILVAQQHDPREEAIADSEARLAQAQRLAHVGSWEWNVQTDRVCWTDELYRIYGLEPSSDTISYETFLSRVAPEDRERTAATVRAALERGEPFVYDHRILRPDGTVRVLHTRGGVVRSVRGAPLRLGGACWDVTDLTKATEEREHVLSLLRATFESTADGLLVVDRDGRLTAYNHRLLELWNLDPSAMENGNFERLLKLVDVQLEPESAAACVKRVRELEHAPEAESFDSLVFQDGRFFERYSRPQRIGGEVVGRVWSYRNVTERERLLRDAQRALAVRDEFLSVVTHEVRGPIASLHLAAQALRRGVPEEARAPLFDVIEREGRRVARFLDELVDLARIRSGKLEYTLASMDLVEVVREVVERLEPEASRVGSTVSIDAPKTVEGRWDRRRVDQIVTNLVSNAIKFGRGRPIEVRISIKDVRACVQVRDHGIGIAEADQLKLFTPFERAVSPRQYGGLGLGLYIVRTLVEGMGGTVHLESEPNVGTTVLVEIPTGRRDS